MNVTGGAIGYGLPCAAGAAVAGQGRRVICAQADGSAMYTLQALWTMARENLPVTTVILANRKYQILLAEYANVGADPGQTAMDMLDLGRPDLDWVKLANGMGVEAARTDTLEGCAELMRGSFGRQGAVFGGAGDFRRRLSRAEMGVKNYLIEGVSGTGKTAVAEELQRRGYHVIHGDRELAYVGDPETGEPLASPAHGSAADTVAWLNKHWIWPVDKVRSLIADQSNAVSFFCGGSRNFHLFIDLFDGVFVLDVDLRHAEPAACQQDRKTSLAEDRSNGS